MTEHAAGSSVHESDRRDRDRRDRSSALRYPERRSGFDRRSDRLWEALLLRYRDADLALVGVLAAANILNVVDYAMTVRALGGGAVEANPVMAALFAHGPWAAGAVKLAAVLAVSLVVWRMRYYKRILEASLVLIGVFSAIAVWQIYGALWLM